VPRFLQAAPPYKQSVDGRGIPVACPPPFFLHSASFSCRSARGAVARGRVNFNTDWCFYIFSRLL
jgi:hypothetical protein